MLCSNINEIWGKEDICILMADSLGYMAEANIAL